MKIESKKKIARAIVSIAFIMIVSSVSLFIADVYTVPINNEATISQLNGGDYEFGAMKSTRSLIEKSQSFIPLIAFLMSGYIIGSSVKKIYNIERGELSSGE